MIEVTSLAVGSVNEHGHPDFAFYRQGVADRARPFGAHVTGVRRSQDTHPSADRIAAMADLPSLLPPGAVAADDQAALRVGRPEQIIGAQARLHVLESDVVDLLAAAERMADIGQHLLGCRLDVDFGGRHAQFAHQPWCQAEHAAEQRVVLGHCGTLVRFRRDEEFDRDDAGALVQQKNRLRLNR